ncbi:MAG: hypothetical protein ACYDCX_11915 [Acidithiobacillus sp.]
MSPIKTNSLFSEHLSRLHEKSEAETYAKVRTQFKGTDEAFLVLARQYADLAPEKKGSLSEVPWHFSSGFDSLARCIT